MRDYTGHEVALAAKRELYEILPEPLLNITEDVENGQALQMPTSDIRWLGHIKAFLLDPEGTEIDVDKVFGRGPASNISYLPNYSEYAGFSTVPGRLELRFLQMLLSSEESKDEVSGQAEKIFEEHARSNGYDPRLPQKLFESEHFGPHIGSIYRQAHGGYLTGLSVFERLTSEVYARLVAMGVPAQERPSMGYRLIASAGFIATALKLASAMNVFELGWHMRANANPHPNIGSPVHPDAARFSYMFAPHRSPLIVATEGQDVIVKPDTIAMRTYWNDREGSLASSTLGCPARKTVFDDKDNQTSAIQSQYVALATYLQRTGAFEYFEAYNKMSLRPPRAQPDSPK